MTTVHLTGDGRGVTAIRVSGHAGYADSGSDIVCAAASVLITTCANALESVAGICPLVGQTQEPAMIEVSLPKGLSPDQDHDARLIVSAIAQGFRDIAAQYPKHLQIF